MNDNVTVLDEYAFYYCTKLANVDLSKSLTKIDGYETFKYTAALKHIDLKNVKELTGWYTFLQSGLEDVDLSNVESVDGIQVFGTCYNLKTVYIGKNTDLSSRLGIGCNCFAGCFKLEKYVQKEKIFIICMLKMENYILLRLKDMLELKMEKWKKEH